MATKTFCDLCGVETAVIVIRLINVTASMTERMAESCPQCLERIKSTFDPVPRLRKEH